MKELIEFVNGPNWDLLAKEAEDKGVDIKEEMHVILMNYLSIIETMKSGN